MAQLSRPYQLGLLAVVLLAAAWLLLIQGHNNSPSAPASQASAPAATSATSTASSPPASQSGSSAHIYHGPAPGVEGLTRDIAKAKGAVETSKQNARQLQEKSAQASGEPTRASTAPSAAAKAPATAAATPTKAAATPAAKAPAPAKSPARTRTTTTSPGAAAKPAMTTLGAQRSVEAQLAQGKIALILFWNPRSADDQAVHEALAQLQHNSRLGIAVHEASAEQVADFGTITRGVQVYGTPTLLVVDKQGKVMTLTGLQDAFSIEQAVQEAKRA